MGLIAPPERPPVGLPMRDLRVRKSTLMAGYVLATVRASLPASAAARAMAAMSDTLGDSFTQSGRRATIRAAATTSAAIRGSLPNCNPPQATLGQEILSS